MGHCDWSWSFDDINQHHHGLSRLLLLAPGSGLPVAYDGGNWEPARKALPPEPLPESLLLLHAPRWQTDILTVKLASAFHWAAPRVHLLPQEEFVLVKQIKLETRRPTISGLVVSQNSVRGFCSLTHDSWMCKAVDEARIFKCRLMTVPEASKKLRFSWPYRDFSCREKLKQTNKIFLIIRTHSVYFFLINSGLKPKNKCVRYQSCFPLREVGPWMHCRLQSECCGAAP